MDEIGCSRVCSVNQPGVLGRIGERQVTSLICPEGHQQTTPGGSEPVNGDGEALPKVQSHEFISLTTFDLFELVRMKFLPFPNAVNRSPR